MKTRLDKLLVDRALAQSRERAQALILAGRVMVDEQKVEKPGTPVDDECSDLFYSIWWPRIPGDDSDVPHGKLREVIEKQFLSTVFDDLQIWRYQKYVEHPALSKVDAKGYMALRKWAAQFYEVSA